MEKEDLKKSYEKFGALYPILTDKDGKVIDGFHRKEIDANWPTMKIDADDESKKQIIALVVHINRREITGAEITKRLDTIAELTGWKPSQIAEETGMRYNDVVELISDKYKDQSAVARGKLTPKPIAANSPNLGEPTDTDSIDTPEDNSMPTTMTEEETAFYSALASSTTPFFRLMLKAISSPFLAWRTTTICMGTVIINCPLPCCMSLTMSK